MNDDKIFKMIYATGQRLGKSMRQAQDLAERAREFTAIEITVVPSKEIERLEKEIHRLRGRLSHYETPTIWIDESGE